MKDKAGHRPFVLITDDRFGDADLERSVLEPAGIEVVVAKCCTAGDVAAAGRLADGLLVNLALVDASAIEALERCRVISRYGVGLDNIDVDAARRRGIAVTRVAGYCNIEVAEHALALLLDTARGISLRDRSIRDRNWNLRPFGRRVGGSTLGILGFGGTGMAFARIASGLGFREMLIWSPHITGQRIAESLGAARGVFGTTVRAAGFEELLQEADWISIHLPLLPETRGIIGARQFSLMKPEAVIINVSRGALVDESALVEALESGRIAGAGLDVFTVEPLPSGSRLRALPNVVFTDHSAYASRESIRELRLRTAENALRELSSKQ